MGLLGLVLLAVGIYLCFTGSLLLGVILIAVALVVGAGPPVYRRW